MYGLRDDALAAVRGFGELTASDGADAWVAAILRLRARASEILGADEAAQIFSDADLIAANATDHESASDCPAKLDHWASVVSEIGWRDAQMQSSSLYFDRQMKGLERRQRDAS